MSTKSSILPNRDIHARVSAMADAAGATYQAKVGLLRDYDNIWDAQVDNWHRRLAWPSEHEIFYACQVSHTPLDYVTITKDTEPAELSKYDVLFYPHALILTPDIAALLQAYVQQGGTLILGARTGMKDVTGQCVMTPMPGLLAPLTGSDVAEFTFIGPADEAQFMNWDGEQVPTGVFSDILHVNDEGAKVLAEYGTDFYRGCPALVENACGKGRVLHFGGTFTRQNVRRFLEYTGTIAPYRGVVALPEACELAVREKDGTEWYYVLNYSAREQVVTLKQPMTDVDTGTAANGDVRLAPYGTKVYRKQK